MKRVKWLDEVHNGRDEIQNCTVDIREIALAFRVTGNQSMYNELNEIADNIFDANLLIQKAISDNINERCNESKRQVGEVLSMAIRSIIDEKER